MPPTTRRPSPTAECWPRVSRSRRTPPATSPRSILSTPATGAIDFTDIDLTDLPTAKITGQVVTSLGADHTTDLTCIADDRTRSRRSRCVDALQQTGKNNGTVTWSYSIADGALDFLGQDQTAKIVSTITLD